MHGKRFGQLDAGVPFRVKQIEQRSLLRVIRARGITRRWSDAAIFFAQKIDIRQVFLAPKTPRDPRLFVQVLSKRFRQPVRQRLGQNRVIIIVLGRKLFCQFIRAVNRYRESAKIILRLRIADCGLRSNVIRQAMIELSGRLLHLLTQEMEGREFLASPFIDIEIDIVTKGVGRPERK